MARFGFVGGTYTSESVIADCQECINWYPESVESGEGNTAIALYRAPGITLFAALPGRSVRAELAINGRLFVVAGTTLYEVSPAGVVTVRGQNLPDDGNMASMAASNIQLLVASGGGLYVLFLVNVGQTVANTFQQVSEVGGSATGPVGPVQQVGYGDGAFLALLTGTNKFQLSNPNDATTWNDLFVSAASVFAENLVSMLVSHREMWLFGAAHTQPYYDSGDANNPWQPIQGAFIEQGCAAASSPAKQDNSVFWLGADERGAGIVWRANGYTPTRVSTHAMENELNKYATIADAIGFAYTEKGHPFYVLFFPTANATWVYDVATSLWHKRGRWIGQQFEAWHAQSHAYAFGKHLVGDWASSVVNDVQTTNLYVSSILTLTDNGLNIRRVRRAPHVSIEKQWIYHHEMQIDLEVGVGPIPGLPGPGVGAMSIGLTDVNGNDWSLSINDAGELQTTESVGAGGLLILNDQQQNVSWQIGMNAAQQLTLTEIVYSAAYAQSIAMITSGTQLQTSLTVVNGQLTVDAPTPGSRDPQIMLRWSDDGGKTWSNERWISAGAAGTYKTRAHWHRLGRSRDRVYEVVVDDPVEWRIIDAYLDADPGFKPVERLNKAMSKMA